VLLQTLAIDSVIITLLPRAMFTSSPLRILPKHFLKELFWAEFLLCIMSFDFMCFIISNMLLQRNE